MADQVFWNRDSEQDRMTFARALAPLVAASRTKTFTRAEATAYMLSLQDVPPTILNDAVAALLSRGVDWMPKPGDLKKECAAVMTHRRKEAYNATLPAECSTCGREKTYKGARWKEVSINGVDRLVRCDCQTVALQAADRVGQAIALPPSREDQTEIAL